MEESVDRGQGPQGLEGHTEKAAQGHMKAAGQESWRLAPPEAVAETVIPLCCWGKEGTDPVDRAQDQWWSKRLWHHSSAAV